MLNPQDITIAAVFTAHRSYNIDSFFHSCLFNDSKAKKCQFVLIDNGCTFDLQKEAEKWLALIPNWKIVKNEKIESLPYNHNLIYFYSTTPYVIHNNDEVFFREQWLSKLIGWVNKGNENKFAHLCRCSKGYYKELIQKVGYFNLNLPGKDSSDSDVEFREIKYLENSQISLADFAQKNHDIFCQHVIGGYWKQEFFSQLNCMSWLAELCVQPGDPNIRDNDSNLWLKNNENLSEQNKALNTLLNYHDLIDTQGLNDITKTFLPITKNTIYKDTDSVIKSTPETIQFLG